MTILEQFLFVSNIWGQLKPYLRESNGEQPEVTWLEMTSVTWPEVTLFTCPIYVCDKTWQFLNNSWNNAYYSLETTLIIIYQRQPLCTWSYGYHHFGIMVLKVRWPFFRTFITIFIYQCHTTCRHIYKWIINQIIIQYKYKKGPNVTDSILMKCVLLQDKIAPFLSQMISSSETDWEKIERNRRKYSC
jgi:hypothetical protein